jgi:hypothetical protein
VLLAADWVTISALATAGGTLVLAVATFASVRSANRAARVAEQSLLVSLRPLLMPSRYDDPPQKINFADDKLLKVEGGRGAVEADGDVVYLGMPLRNAGTGIAVLHGWHFRAGRTFAVPDHAPLEEFRRLSRDLYVSPGDVGFWQGAFRDPSEPGFAEAKRCAERHEDVTIELLYGDLEGAQRMISRYALLPRDDGAWIASASRHWNVDGRDPR